MSAPFVIPPGLNIHDSRQAELYGASITTWILAVLAVALRLWARRLMKSRYWLDDWFAIIALAFGTGLFASTLVWIHQGYGKHFEILGKTFVTDFFKNLFTGEILYTLVICSVKFSILAFYWRLFGASIRIPCILLGSITLCWTLAVILVTIFQCDPVSGFWNRNIPAKCKIDDYAFFVGIAVPNIITDAAIIALPMPYIWQLHRMTSQKIALAGIFMLGSFVTIISIVRLATLVHIDLKNPDLDYNFAFVGVWTITESNIAIVSACLPSHRPILHLILHGTPNPSAYGSRSNRSWRKSQPSASNGGHRSESESQHNFVALSDEAAKFSGAKASRTTVTVGERRTSDPYETMNGIEMQPAEQRTRKNSVIHVRSDVNVKYATNE